ncbi:tyrosine-type recombinase/integrase [Limosilactobacillus reuteri]|nr:tyrosine-type recombinase/integrase [Limosilactobacillus reuteri]MCC4500157.1 site-specific integrase [Limosilactobacillus reuteri]MCC4506475.1 site-specific integrase [Limosilactobacillus reuteri]
MVKRRKDSKNRVLKTGESERKQGGYQYRWKTGDGRRHYIYASNLNTLRTREKKVIRDVDDNIRTNNLNLTLNDLYNTWIDIKKGLKPNTFNNYKYMYEHFVKETLGKYRIRSLHKTDIKRFYNHLIDDGGLKVNTVGTIHLVIHQILQLAVDDDILRKNVSDNGLEDLKKIRGLHGTKRKALTVAQQNLFLKFILDSPKYRHWYPTFAIMLGSGLRVGELTGLRWKDVDFENNVINVNHTLVFYEQSKSNHTGFGINTPKTEAGYRSVPMIQSVRDAFFKQKKYLKDSNLESADIIDGFRNFIFINRFGHVQHQGTLNKAIKRIIRDANFDALEKDPSINNDDLLPNFSCHTLRHTFTTRLIESGMNVKVIQEALGHSDIQTTLNIYADVTKELKKQQFAQFDDFITANDSVHQ